MIKEEITMIFNRKTKIKKSKNQLNYMEDGERRGGKEENKNKIFRQKVRRKIK